MQSSHLDNIFIHDQSKVYKKVVKFDDFKIGIFVSKSKVNRDNEDCLFLTKEKEVLRFAVADGAGGHPRGKDASFLVLDELRKLKPESILDQIEIANNKILDLKAGAKSTLALAQINGNKISFYTVGDSEILYWNGVGRKLFSSIPNSPTGLKVEAGVISQEDSLTDPERHIVNSFLGDSIVKINSTTSFELKKGHTILLGTDGLYDNISHQRLCDMISGGSFEKSFEKLVNFCESKEKTEWLKDDDIAFFYLRKTKA